MLLKQMVLPMGGSSILVKPSTPHTQIKLQTGLQAIAIRATLRKTITVCSIYLPPTMVFNSTDLENLIAQLLPPILLLGDFNAHSTLWGCSKTDLRRKMIEDLLLKHNLSILNNGSNTYLHPATGSSSAIDLSIASPSLI